MPRSMLMLLLLAGSVGIPYALNQPDGVGGLIAKVKSMFAAGDAPPGSEASTDVAVQFSVPLQPSAAAVAGMQPVGTPRPVAGQSPTMPLEEVIRFDIQRDWVFARWPRATTGLARVDYFGVRVPLVTGTRIEDLAGSLTYYYDAEGQLQHISLHGVTGSPRTLVTLLTTHFYFRPQRPDVPGEQLYEVRWNSQVQSRLRVRAAGVMKSDQPRTSFRVELELSRPGSERFLE